MKKSGEGKEVGRRHSENEFDVDEDLKDLADVVEKHAEADEVLVDHTVLKLAQDCVNRSDQVYSFTISSICIAKMSASQVFSDRCEVY